MKLAAMPHLFLQGMLLRLRHKRGIHGGGHSRVRVLLRLRLLLLLLLLLLLEGTGLPRIEAHLRLLRRSGLLSLLLGLLSLLRSRLLLLLLLLLLGSCCSGGILLLRIHAVRSTLRIQLLRLLRLRIQKALELAIVAVSGCFIIAGTKQDTTESWVSQAVARAAVKRCEARTARLRRRHRRGAGHSIILGFGSRSAVR